MVFVVAHVPHEQSPWNLFAEFVKGQVYLIKWGIVGHDHKLLNVFNATVFNLVVWQIECEHNLGTFQKVDEKSDTEYEKIPTF